MNEALKTCCPQKSEGSLSVISSQASESGPMPCAKPDGLMTAQSGPDPARANLSARQAKEAGVLTSGTHGPRSFTSLRLSVLSRSLGNRLQAKTALLGSTLFKLTWKLRDTPSGLWISALRASVRRTSDK